MLEHSSRDIRRTRSNIQSFANVKFPAQELWMRNYDKMFWAFSIQNGEIVSTVGELHNRTYKCRINHYPYSQELLDTLIEQRKDENFECFSILS